MGIKPISQSEDALGGGPSQPKRVVSILAGHADHTFRPREITKETEIPTNSIHPKEIHEETAIPRGSVGTVLSRLEQRGLVRHQGEYWAITDDADVETTLTAMSTARAATDRLGPEDPEEWGPGVDNED